MHYSCKFVILLHTLGKWDDSVWSREKGVYSPLHPRLFKRLYPPLQGPSRAPLHPWFPFYSVLPAPWGGDVGSRRLDRDDPRGGAPGLAMDEGFPCVLHSLCHKFWVLRSPRIELSSHSTLEPQES